MSFSDTWKNRIARSMRWPFLRRFMHWGIRLFVPKRPVGVGLVLTDRNGRILLLRHVFHPEHPWGLPGGWLKRHETPQDGALRELQEETGLTADLGPVLAIDDIDRPFHIGITFLASLPAGQPPPLTLSSEIIAADWFRPDDLPDLLPFHQQAIETAVRYRQSYAPFPNTKAIR